MAAGKKRVLDEASGTPKAKKTKTEEQTKKSKDKAEKPTQPVSSLVSDDIDFPRGGGTTLTPLEVKTLRAEAAKEVDKELFAVRPTSLASSFNINNIYPRRLQQRSPLNARESQRRGVPPIVLQKMARKKQGSV